MNRTKSDNIFSFKKHLLHLSGLSTLLLLILLTAACNTSKKVAGKKLKKRKPSFLLEELNQNRKTAEWLSTKALIQYKDDNQRIKITSNIRIRKDSVIWLNVKKLGIEAARIQITPDSIIILDRLNKTYLAKDFDYVGQQFSFPQAIADKLDFRALQDLFLGNPILIPVQKFESSISDGYYQLEGQYEHIDAQYLIEGQDYELASSYFVDHEDGKSIYFQFSDYRAIDNQREFSYFRNIDLTSPQTGLVEMALQLSKVEFDVPKTIRFEIPSRYTEME